MILRRIESKLDLILAGMELEHEVMADVASELEALRAQVHQNESVEASAVALIQGLAQQLRNAQQAEDPGAAISEIVQGLQTSQQQLAASIAANTPGNTGVATADTNAAPATGVPGVRGAPADQPPNTANPNSPNADPLGGGVLEPGQGS
jgi:hypothetical protein